MIFKLIDNQRKENCLQYISQLPVEGQWVVQIRRPDKTRQQEKLWHDWLGEMSLKAKCKPEVMKVAVKRLILGMDEFTCPLSGQFSYLDKETRSLNVDQYSGLMTETEVIAYTRWPDIKLIHPDDAPSDLWQR